MAAAKIRQSVGAGTIDLDAVITRCVQKLRDLGNTLCRQAEDLQDAPGRVRARQNYLWPAIRLASAALSGDLTNAATNDYLNCRGFHFNIDDRYPGTPLERIGIAAYTCGDQVAGPWKGNISADIRSIDNVLNTNVIFDKLSFTVPASSERFEWHKGSADRCNGKDEYWATVSGLNMNFDYRHTNEGQNSSGCSSWLRVDGDKLDITFAGKALPGVTIDQCPLAKTSTAPQ